MPPEARVLTEAAAAALNDHVRRTGIRPRLIERPQAALMFHFSAAGLENTEHAAFHGELDLGV